MSDQNLIELKNKKKRKSGVTRPTRPNFSSENNNPASTVKKQKLKPAATSKISNSTIEDISEKFEELFLNEDKITDKRVREFTKEAFSVRRSDNSSSNIANEPPKLNYNNLIFFLLKFSGLEVENNPNYKRLINSINSDNCADFELLDEIIANSKVKNENFKTNKTYSIFEAIVSEIYNNYEISENEDFEILKKLIQNFLKLTNNKYRKIRYYSSLILINIFKLTLEELVQSKKLFAQRSKKSKVNLEKFVKNNRDKKTLEESTNSFLEAKIKILSDLIQILKEQFIFKKVADVSKNIRLVICDYIIKISKNHFNELFSDESLVSFYPFFLIDSSTNIKYKYLQLLYEKLDVMEENKNSENNQNNEINENSKNSNNPTPTEESPIKIIIKILSVARDAILNICVKEDKLVAKQAVKIIELLSQHNILEIKTVQSLLPHLFNPEVQIRNLISKVVVNYILDFEKNISNNNNFEENEDEDEDDQTKTENKKVSKSKRKNETPYKINTSSSNYTHENLMQLLEFFLKLSENEEKMVKVLVDNFYDHLGIFTHYNLFFELIELLLNNSDQDSLSSQDTIQNSQNILQTALLVLNFSVQKLQSEIELQDNAQEFANVNVNLYPENNNNNSGTNQTNNNNSSSVSASVSASPNSELNKTLIPKNEEFLNNFLNSITNFIKKIRINLNTPTQCENFVFLLQLFERFKIYKQNIIKFNTDKLILIVTELKNSFFINMRQVSFAEEDQNFFENLVEAILKALYKLIFCPNLSNNFNHVLENVVFSDNSQSLAREYCEILYKEILSTTFFATLSNLKSDEFNINNFYNNNNNDTSLSVSHTELMNKLYIILTQFNYLLVYFKDIFVSPNNNNPNNSINSDSENLLNLFTFSNFIENLIRFLYKFLNKSSGEMILIFFKVVNISLKLIENIHLINFNEVLTMNTNNNFNHYIERYISHRNNTLITISYIINEFSYEQGNSDNNIRDINFLYNNEMIKLKTAALGNLLEMFVYITSDKIDTGNSNQNLNLKFIIEDEMTDMIEKFVKNNFIKFYFDYNKNSSASASASAGNNNGNSQGNIPNNNTQTQYLSQTNSLFTEELSLKTILFKTLCEKFSRLLLLNLGIFKYTSFCCIYFETFYLLKLPAVIENLNAHVYESLLEKEIMHHAKITSVNNNLNINNNNSFNNNTTSLSYSNSMNIMIFYLTKITMRIFCNKSKLYMFPKEEGTDNDNANLTATDKTEMITRFATTYVKLLKKMKIKYNKDNFDVLSKDKAFFENFIINSINFALESRKEVPEKNEENVDNNDDEEDKENIPVDIKYTIHIENVKFFNIIKYFLKSSNFLSQSDFKNILMIFLKLSKSVELMENVHRGHISTLERFKSFLLSKAKVYIANEDGDEEGNEEDKMDVDVDVEDESNNANIATTNNNVTTNNIAVKKAKKTKCKLDFDKTMTTINNEKIEENSYNNNDDDEDEVEVDKKNNSKEDLKKKKASTTKKNNITNNNISSNSIFDPKNKENNKNLRKSGKKRNFNEAQKADIEMEMDMKIAKDTNINADVPGPDKKKVELKTKPKSEKKKHKRY